MSNQKVKYESSPLNNYEAIRMRDFLQISIGVGHWKEEKANPKKTIFTLEDCTEYERDYIRQYEDELKQYK